MGGLFNDHHARGVFRFQTGEPLRLPPEAVKTADAPLGRGAFEMLPFGVTGQTLADYSHHAARYAGRARLHGQAALETRLSASANDPNLATCKRLRSASTGRGRATAIAVVQHATSRPQQPSAIAHRLAFRAPVPYCGYARDTSRDWFGDQTSIGGRPPPLGGIFTSARICTPSLGGRLWGGLTPCRCPIEPVRQPCFLPAHLIWRWGAGLTTR